MCKIKFLTSNSVEKEKAEKLVIAVLSNFDGENFGDTIQFLPNLPKFSIIRISIMEVGSTHLISIHKIKKAQFSAIINISIVLISSTFEIIRDVRVMEEM